MDRKRPTLQVVRPKKGPGVGWAFYLLAGGVTLTIIAAFTYDHITRERARATWTVGPALPVAPSMPSRPGPADGYVTPPLKVTSCNTIPEDMTMSAYVVAEGRSYLVGGGRFFCLYAEQVQEAMFAGEPFLCAMDGNKHGSCARIVDR